MSFSLVRLVLMSMIAVLLCPNIRAEEEEETVPLDKLPKVVIDAVKKMFPDAELKAATKEVVKEAAKEEDEDDNDDTADGKEKEDKDEKQESEVVYEVTLSQKGRTIDVAVEEDGEIEEVEQSIDLNELPKIVADELANKFPKSKLKSAEVIYEVEDGRMELQGYEVILISAEGKEIEADVDVEIEIAVD